MNETLRPALSDSKPNEVAPTNLPSDTATATDVRQKLRSHTKFHCEMQQKTDETWPMNELYPLLITHLWHDRRVRMFVIVMEEAARPFEA